MAIAVYAGSFDPITAGHLSVVRHAARLFAHLRVLVACNPDKAGLFTPVERTEMVAQAVRRLPNVSVDQTEGLVVEYARSIGASFLVRGIRGASDAAFETDLAQANRKLAPEIDTILLPAEAELAAVSSSGLKDRARRGETLAPYCSDEVAERLRARFAGGV